MGEVADALYRIVCRVLAPRCGGGEAAVEALGEPLGPESLDRWVAAGLLSPEEAARLRQLSGPAAQDEGTVSAVLALGSAPDPMDSSAEWGWGLGTDSERTVPELTLGRNVLPAAPPAASWSWSDVEVSADLMLAEGDDSHAPTPAPQHARFVIAQRLHTTPLVYVHAARDRLLGRDLAVSVHRTDSPLDRAGFIAATRVQADLQHPNIQPIYELDEDPEQGVFAATSHILEADLAQVLKAVALGHDTARARYGTLRLIEILLDIARAVSFAHRRGVLHRDLRPGQVQLGGFGEVQLGGWLRARRKNDPLDEPRDAALSLVDSGLGFLAPERLEHGLHACTPASDIWGLGAILYAIITRRPPFRGRSSTELIESIRSGAATPALDAAVHGSELPEALRALCAQALEIEPSRRRLSAEEMVSELENFLDGTRAAARNLERAEELLEDARHLARHFEELSGRLHTLIVEEACHWAEAPTEATQLLARRVRLDALRAETERSFHRADDAFGRNQAAMPGYEPARYAQCALYLRALQLAESGHLTLPQDLLREAITQLDPGGLTEPIAGLTHLEVHTSPQGLPVTFHRYVDERGHRLPDAGQSVGNTPFALANAVAGDYLLTVQIDARLSFRLPVSLGPAERLSLHFTVPTSIPEGAVFVPAGPAQLGAPAAIDNSGWSLPRGTAELVSYFIARDPVTLGDYGRFLNALRERGPAVAHAHAPRAFHGAEPFWQPTPSGYQLPFNGPDGQPWTADHPVVGVTVADVEAYCAWKTRQDGHPWRLPTELEWEKAARGPEGRPYPWGTRPEPGFCHHLGSDAAPQTLRPVGAISTDNSVYGVRDLAGGVRELTASVVSGRRVLRGGGWLSPFTESALWVRAALTEQTPLLSLGFRLALDGPDGTAAVPPEVQPDPPWTIPQAPAPFVPSQGSSGAVRSEELTVEGRSVLLGQQHRRLPPARETRTVDRIDTGPERYVVLDEIARGSMGRVVLAYDDVLQRHVALKILHDKHRDDQLARYRFTMEARITGRLQHTSVVPVYDIGELSGGQRFFAMKPIDGLALQDVLRGRASGDRRTLAEFGRDRLLTVMRRVCQGLAYAHQHQVVHRDLKPANILVGEFGEVAIVDLGLARQLVRDPSDHTDVAEASQLIRDDGRITRVGSVIGTPYYMSPEQAMGLQDAVGPASDVYGLGAILYHILTHRPPFSGQKVNEVLIKVRRGNAPPPSRAAPDQEVPPELDDIVMRALSMNPDVRPSSALALADELAAFQEATRLHETDRVVAEQRASRAGIALDTYEAEQSTLDQLRARLHALRTEVRQSDPLERRWLWWQATTQVEQQSATVISRLAEAVRQARLALDNEQPVLRTRLTVALQTLHLRAEADRVAEVLVHTERWLRSLDTDGELTRWLAPTAPVSVRTISAQLGVTVAQLTEQQRRPRELAVARGVTPLEIPRAPATAGTVAITSGGHTLRVPFVAARDRPVEIELTWPAGQRPGYLIIPAGRFLYGGDPIADEGQPPRSARLGTYQIARHPVTCLEYLGWLDELATQDPTQRAAREPRLGPDGPALWGPVGQRLFGGFSPHRPVTGITLADAHAYARWLGLRLNSDVRLPTSAEWEKAARGVDGRRWPWGDRYEPSFCGGAEAGLSDVGQLPEDLSVYGMQDIASGVLEWTLTAARDDNRACFVRGGCGALGWRTVACVSRIPWNPQRPSPFIGFRLVIAGT